MMAAAAVLSLLLAAAHAEYLVGIGKADITGPVADVNLMGYAMPLQIARGIHIRLFARAYVFADPQQDRRRFVYVVSDACMSSQLVTMRVLDRLQEEYGDLYTADNVVLSGTHTHASPAGFLQYVLYSITSLGFVTASFDALVEGITEAISLAHADVSPAVVSWASGQLLGANINRSPSAYEANPASERAAYSWDVDKEMDVLRISHPHPQPPPTGPAAGGSDDSGEGGSRRGHGRGLISWFPVHCTSMNNTNPFVSGDNKGAAAQLLERDWRAAAQQHTARTAPPHSSKHPSSSSASSWWRSSLGLLERFQSWKEQPAEQQTATATAAASVPQGFAAAFAQSSVGDTSPNVQGAFCLDTGKTCEMQSSTCGGRNELCHGRGPAWPDDTASTAIIGQHQADKARELWGEVGVEVAGDIDYRHVFINMSNVKVLPSKWTRGGQTCPPAMGMSFAAGTTDGPGAFDFRQGDVNGTAFWRLVRDFISPPSAQQQACQAPKPILLNTGYMNLPYPWQPHVTELSVIRLGNQVIVSVPGEFTTMAGRRIKAAVEEAVGDAWGTPLKVVLSGLSGTYASYITTYEEYQVQRYEGASTLHGPHTLDAYIQTALQLVQAMLSGAPVSSDVTPPDLQADQIGLLGPVVRDAVPSGAAFGDVVVQPAPGYSPGQTAEAVFRSGCPRNNLRRGGSFLAVQCLAPDGTWADVAGDDDWATHFYWERHWKLSAQSFATIRWAIPNDTAPDTYRLTHYGDWKPLFGTPRPFAGSSNTFTVTASSSRVRTHAGDTPVSAGQRQACSVDPTAMLVLGPAAAGWAQHEGGTGDRYGIQKYKQRGRPGLFSDVKQQQQHQMRQQLLRDVMLSLTEHGVAQGSDSQPLGSKARQQQQQQQSSSMTPEERWAAMSSLFQPSVQLQARFRCGHAYVAWWRGEGVCGEPGISSFMLHGYCTYGPTT